MANYNNGGQQMFKTPNGNFKVGAKWVNYINQFPDYYNPLAGGNFLSAATVEQFKEAGALGGTDGNGITYTIRNILVIGYYGNYYLGLIGYINSSNYINNCCFVYSRGIAYTTANIISQSTNFLAPSDGRQFIENSAKNYCYLFLSYDSTHSVLQNVAFMWGAGRVSHVWLDYPTWVSGGTGSWGSFYNYLLASGSGISFPLSPYESEEGGGNGDYNTNNTSVDFPTIPTLTMLGTGLVNVWNPSAYDLKQLNSWLWRDTSIFDDAKKLIDSPLSLISSLKMLPCAVSVGSEEHFCLAGVDSNINMRPVTNQFVTIDCGTVTITEFFGSALDYGAYTKLRVFLPFIGIKDLSPDDCMGGKLQIKYIVDVVTGDCVACLKCTRQNLSNVLYTYGGNMAYDVPISGLNYGAKNKADVMALSGAVGGIMSQNPSQVISSAMGIMTNKPTFERASDLKGNTGFIGERRAFLIIERPIQSLPSQFNHYKGSPSNITAQLGSLTGYTEVDTLIETNIHCTDTEFDEINELLKEGVYL